MLTKLSPIFLVLGVIKRIALEKTYFQFFFVVFSIVKTIQAGKLNPKSLFVISSISIFAIVQTYFIEAFSSGSYLKWIQLIIMCSLLDFLCEEILKNIEKITKVVISLSIVELLLNYFLGYAKYYNTIFGINILRIQGVVGEPNFSALFLFMLYLVNKKKTRYFLVPLIFLTGSKTTIMLVLLSMLLHYLNRKTKKYFVCLSTVFFVAYPLISITAFHLSSFEKQAFLTNLTSHRFMIHYMYSKYSLTSIFGHGIVTDVNKQYNNKPQEIEVFEEKWHRKIVEGEEHSLPVEIAYKFGIFGLLLLVIFLLKNVENITTSSALLLLNLINLNGLFELVTFFIISSILLMKRHRRHTFSEYRREV